MPTPSNKQQPSEGPWEVHETGDQVLNSDGFICDVWMPYTPSMSSNQRRSEQKANAQLIASAPELKRQNEALVKAALEMREWIVSAADDAAERAEYGEQFELEKLLVRHDETFAPILDAGGCDE